MSGERKYTRIPPESTGDRVYMVHTAEIEYNNKSTINPTHSWVVGARYDIAGFNGGKVHVHGVYESGDTGVLSVHYNKTAKFENSTPTVGSKISIGGVEVADVASFYDLYIPAQNIMGYDNPEYGLDVDITGSANVRFSEGLPQLDAWGKLRVSGATHIGDYVFGQEEALTNNFSPSQIQGGSVDYNDSRNSVTIKLVGPSDPNHVDSSGFAAITSNLYHHYVAGSSHLYMSTARLNNPTATGVVRNWGLFDSNNGFMFRVGADGLLYVVIRSSITGSTVDNVISRSSWNGDKVDGTGDSQAILDLSKDNIYWVDIQWHGAGRVRFGTYIDGARVTMHSYYHGNNYESAMSQTASLPVCFSAKAVTGPSEDLFIETWSASVWTETDVDLNTKGVPSNFASTHTTITADAADDWQYLFSISPKVELPNGEVNHSLYMPTSVSAYAYDSAATNGLDAIIDLKMEINSVHSGHSFSPISSSTVEVSTAGTSYGSGKALLQEMFRGRYQNETTDTFNNWQSGAVKNFSDDGGTIINNISSITTGNAGAPPVVTVAAGERVEVRETGNNGQGAVEFPLNAAEYNGRYEFYDLTSVPELNGQYVYVKPIAANQFEIYSDEALTTGFTVTSTHSANQGYVKGFRGSRIAWSAFAKTRTGVHPTGPVKLMVTINWKEITQ
jgi:hypothetical protein